MAVARFPTAAPRLPRSVTEPSFSQSTACGPNATGGRLVFPHLPDAPTAWPLSFIQRAIPTVSPGRGWSSRIVLRCAVLDRAGALGGAAAHRRSDGGGGSAALVHDFRNTLRH